MRKQVPSGKLRAGLTGRTARFGMTSILLFGVGFPSSCFFLVLIFFSGVGGCDGVWESRFLTGRTARFGMTSILLSVLIFLVFVFPSLDFLLRGRVAVPTFLR